MKGAKVLPLPTIISTPNKHKIKKLIAGVYDKNISSKKVLEKNKFKLEGVIFKKYIFEGKRMSEYVYGKLL